ncbi:hypothetical protein GALMADRAFT_141674 [Galerina marginata CBS 339.88]|uniref:Uncharacterized protein n=1 Tax=Galerina marginata (strain CBS 339.88) TaxID=685588 RepID=A0A067T1U5_GALM3|nr:hypothetical protein GALMADRAFT_141674 [Galerina marginata CBS 339.88]
MLLSDSEKGGGRVQIINGDLYYSPNSRRDITDIPKPDHHQKEGVCANIFNPSGSLSHNVSFMNLSDYQSPRWWNLQFGWVGFTPRNPKFSGPVLAILDRIPQARELDFAEGKGYGMPPEALHEWSGLENDIKHMVMLLGNFTGIPIILPPYPEVFGYKARHSSRKTAILSFRRSRDWFVLWIAAISFRIAVAETKTEATMHSIRLALADWYTHLVSKGCWESWLDGLTMSPMVQDFSLWTERAGTFVSLPKLQEDLRWPRIEWLCRFNIEVWYLWKPEWASTPKFATFSPLDYQLQSIATGNPSNHAISIHEHEASALPDEAPEPSQEQNHLPSWHEWLEEREKENAQIERVESKQRRNEQLARQKTLTTKTARVFEWKPNDHGVLVRTKVSSTLNDDTLERYERGHVRYDAFRHEWDCCEEMGEAGGYTDDDDYSDDDDHMAGGDTFTAVGMGQTDEEGMLENKNTSWAHRGNSLRIDNNGILHNPGKTSDEEQVDSDWDLEGYILDILRQRYGYTGLIPLPNCPSFDVKAQNKFMKFIGLQWKKCYADTFNKPAIQAAYDFTLRLASNGVIADDEWDIARLHRESVQLLPRFSCIRLLTVNLGKDSSGNDKVKTWYMFDLGEKRTKPWLFTVMAASHALMICRLDAAYNDVDLACFCLSNGTPFKTMQLSSTLTRAPYSSSSLSVIVSRSHKYEFILDDYATYQRRCVEFLTTNRRGRVACMMGGITWRVAGDNDVQVKWSIVLNGPCGWSPNSQEFVLGRERRTNLEYMDDALTEAEVADICGQYECLTGNGMQIRKPSWYPMLDTFNGSGFDYGYWTEICEIQFKNWRWKATNPKPPDTLRPTRPPMNVGQWSSNLKGSSDMRKAASRVNKIAENALNV